MTGLSLEELAQYELSVKQAAQLCGVGVQTIRLHIREGRLKAIQPGKSYRIRRADLEAFMTGQAASEPAEPALSMPLGNGETLQELLFEPREEEAVA